MNSKVPYLFCKRPFSFTRMKIFVIFNTSLFINIKYSMHVYLIVFPTFFQLQHYVLFCPINWNQVRNFSSKIEIKYCWSWEIFAPFIDNLLCITPLVKYFSHLQPFFNTNALSHSPLRIACDMIPPLLFFLFSFLSMLKKKLNTETMGWGCNLPYDVIFIASKKRAKKERKYIFNIQFDLDIVVIILLVKFNLPR